MVDNHHFTAAETIPFIGIIITVVAVFAISYFRDPRLFWSPLMIIAGVYAYYCILGPYEAIMSGETLDRLVNMRKYYPSALWGALISLLAMIFGFLSTGNRQRIFPKVPAVSDEVLFIYGRRILLVGTLLFAIATRGNLLGLLNPFDAQAIDQGGGSLSNYFFLSINFLIPGISMLFLYWFRTRRRFWWFAIPLVLCAGVYITIGFRYRIILLLASLAGAYFLSVGRRPNIIIAPILIAGLISVMGIINLTRNYNAGLDAKKLEGSDTEAYYKSGLRESMIVQTSGAVIDNVPTRHPYVYFAPLVSTIFFPIPQALYPEKNSAEYLESILKTIYGSQNYKGGAFMAYAEHYLAFGWFGVFGIGFFFGFAYKKLWTWYLDNADNVLAIIAYSTTVAYAYMLLSRAYLPQVTMLFFFSVFPAYFIIWLVRRRSVRSRTFQTSAQ